MRAYLVLLATCLAVAIIGAGFVLAVGRAADSSARTFVTFTRDGVTLTCERRYGAHGAVSYGPCDRVSP